MGIIIGTKKMADMLGVSRETLYRYMKDGLPYIQLSSKKRAFEIDKVNEWIKER